MSDEMENDLELKIKKLHGPILVLGASGFIGANIFRTLFARRTDVYGTSSRYAAWRLEGYPAGNIIVSDLLVESNLVDLLNTVKPRTVFSCVAYGAYSFEKDERLIYRTNVDFHVQLLEDLARRDTRCFIHAGTSSEYGASAASPAEDVQLTPNSHYAASKAATSQIIYYYGKHRGFPCANLRLYSVYGPLEDSSRLIPAVVAKGVHGNLPSFVDPSISRDFVYVDDAVEAFIDTAINLPPERYGEAFNIGSGKPTAIGEIARLAKDMFKVQAEPVFSMTKRDWDVEADWYANQAKTKAILGWEAKTSLPEGLEKTAEWYKTIPDEKAYHDSSKRFALDHKNSVSAVVACYRDEQAIPIMYERLTKTFEKLRIDYEIIFVNDNSPDNSEEVIRSLSAKDRRVIGVSHSRNFGSQAAFRSGMEISSKNACVLLDGDLQDPPELIERFVEKWREGYQVVYGRRVTRQAPLYMRFFYKLFYRLFDRFSYIDIPHDAGDFSLINKKVVRCMLKFRERDLFLRGVRAYAGFRQTGVDYVRPERMFGVTTNSFLKNIDWAKKGILSFSNAPLNMLSFFGVILLFLVALLGGVQIFLKLFYPGLTPRGITTTLLVIMFFGAFNIFAVSLIGEYIAKIFEEVKRRPIFLRKAIIRDGELRDASEDTHRD